MPTLDFDIPCTVDTLFQTPSHKFLLQKEIMREEPRTNILPLALLSLLVSTCYFVGILCSNSVVLLGPSAHATLAARGTTSGPEAVWSTSPDVLPPPPQLRGSGYHEKISSSSSSSSHRLFTKKLLLLGLLIPSFVRLFQQSDGDDGSDQHDAVVPDYTVEPYGRRPHIVKRSDTRHLQEVP